MATASKKSDAETQKLFDENLSEAIAFARSQFVHPPWDYLRDEIIQCARLALWEAAQGFDSARRTPFLAYARIVIKSRVLTLLAKERRQSTHETPILGIQSTRSEEGIPVGMLAVGGYDDPAAGLAREDSREIIEVFFREVCTEKEIAVLQGVMAGLTLADIGKKMGGIAASSVSETRNRAAEKFRQWTQDNDIAIRDIFDGEIFRPKEFQVESCILSSQASVSREDNEETELKHYKMLERQKLLTDQLTLLEWIEYERLQKKYPHFSPAPPAPPPPKSLWQKIDQWFEVRRYTYLKRKSLTNKLTLFERFEYEKLREKYLHLETKKT